MKGLSPAVIHAIVVKAGFSGEAAITATAIVLAESGGRPNAIGDINNPGPGAKSVGLFQINYLPSRDSKASWRDPVANLDPLTNARNAYRISNHGTNFRPWTTFVAGIYKRFLATVRAAVPAPVVKPPPAPLPAPTAPPALSDADAQKVAALTLRIMRTLREIEEILKK